MNLKSNKIHIYSSALVFTGPRTVTTLPHLFAYQSITASNLRKSTIHERKQHDARKMVCVSIQFSLSHVYDLFPQDLKSNTMRSYLSAS